MDLGQVQMMYGKQHSHSLIETEWHRAAMRSALSYRSSALAFPTLSANGISNLSSISLTSVSQSVLAHTLLT